jgi:hypothetical protein
VAALDQLDRVDDDDARANGIDATINFLDDAGMGEGIQVRKRSGVGKDDRPECLAVETAIGRDDAAAEALDEPLKQYSCRPRCCR